MNKKRTSYTKEEKAKVVLELLREEHTLNEVARRYGVSPQLISRWKNEFIENMPLVFDKKAAEVEKAGKKHEAEKESLISQIGQLTVEINWLKKKQLQSLQLFKKRV